MSISLVTGGAGFIGSHLVELLQKQNEQVVVIDDLSSGLQKNLNSNVVFYNFSIANFTKLRKLFKNYNINTIYHLGAQSSVTVSTKKPHLDLRSNILGTLNILEIIKNKNIDLVFASTGGAIYDENLKLPTKENDKLNPKSPYGISKLSCEIYIQNWSRRFDKNYTICRLANVYGSRQRFDGEAGVVSIITHKLLTKKPIELYGYGKCIRDYIHVSDVVNGMLAAKGHSGIYNISTSRQTNTLELYNIIMNKLKIFSEPKLLPLREGELQKSCLSNEKAKKSFDWQPQIELKIGVSNTIESMIQSTKSRSSKN